MDELSTEIEYEDSLASFDGVAVYVKVLVNGQRLDNILDIDQFFQSFGINGLSPLFTCTCGTFGCGGYYVEVESTNEGLVIRNRYDPQNKSLLLRFEYHLPWRRVVAVAEQILSILRAIHTERPQAEIFSGAYGNNIVERIEKYSAIENKLVLERLGA